VLSHCSQGLFCTCPRYQFCSPAASYGLGSCCYNESLCPPPKVSEAAAPEATEAATAAPSRIANTGPAVPERVILRPFMPIKLKKAPPGLAPRFPSEIRTVQAAIKFVNSLDPKTRAKLHWRLAASALAALDTGAIRQGAYDRANKAMRNALATECWLAD
jgi:hypothetical protein